jgi:hypothetical protein
VARVNRAAAANFIHGAWDCTAWSSLRQGEIQVGAIPTRSTTFVRRKRLHAGRSQTWPEEVRDSTAADWEDEPITARPLTPQGRSNANMTVFVYEYSRGPDGSAAGSRDMVAAKMNVRVKQNRGYGCGERMGRKH